MLIAFEGIDGSGKGAQTALLEGRATQQRIRTRTFSFPRYGTNSFSKAVSMYLNGEFGSTESVSPYLSALLYAGDRFATRTQLLDACRTHDLVICDRYVDSNIAHQAAKLPESRRNAFLEWIEDIEYAQYAMPPADLTIQLAVPTTVAMKLIARKSARSYTSLAADIHEADERYLDECTRVYAFLAARAKSQTYVVQSMSPSGLRSPESIADEIWNVVAGHVGSRSSQSKSSDEA